MKITFVPNQKNIFKDKKIEKKIRNYLKKKIII